MSEEEQELCFVTVIGEDQKGIIAKMSQKVYDRDINIEDISQKVVDGKFVMNMVVDVADFSGELDQLRTELQDLGDQMGLKVQLQHEDVLESMQRV